MTNILRVLVVVVSSALIGGVVALTVKMHVDATITESLYPNPHEVPLRSIEKFGPLQVGLKSPDRPGDFALAPDYTIPHSQFYIFAQQKELGISCTYEDCGMSGVLVKCLGGWLSGSDQATNAEQYGLDAEAVQKEDTSLIVVADRHSNIVGIYPNHATHNIPRILKKHPDLYDNEAWKWCTDYHMPR